MLDLIDEDKLEEEVKLRRQWGLRFMKIENYEAAIDAFRWALDNGGDDFMTLISLCKVLLKIGNYEEAEKISRKCIELEPDNYEAKWMRVETLYGIGEFGCSLVEAYRGYRGRSYPFENGIYRGRETVENCIGRNTADNVLIEMMPWMKKLEEQRESLIAKLSERNELEGC